MLAEQARERLASFSCRQTVMSAFSRRSPFKAFSHFHIGSHIYAFPILDIFAFFLRFFYILLNLWPFFERFSSIIQKAAEYIQCWFVLDHRRHNKFSLIWFELPINSLHFFPHMIIHQKLDKVNSANSLIWWERLSDSFFFSEVFFFPFWIEDSASGIINRTPPVTFPRYKHWIFTKTFKIKLKKKIKYKWTAQF